MVEPFEITLTGIVLRGDWQFRGSLIIGDTGKTLLFDIGDDEFADAVVECVDAISVSDVAPILDGKPADDADRATVVAQDAAVEDASSECVAIECDVFVSKDAVDVIHDSSPVVVRTNTVADAGEAASFPGQGPE